MAQGVQELQLISFEEQPYGSNLPGGNFKFTILDAAGNRVPAQSESI